MQKIRTLPKSFSLGEKIILLLLLLAVMIFGISFAKGFYLANTESTPTSGGNYTEGLMGRPNLINPLFSSINSVDRDIEGLIFSRLFRYDESRQLTPDLVESYEISDDKKTYAIKIKPNVFWHDGEELKADDVIFTIHRLLDPQTKSPLLISLSGVTVEKVDDYSIKLNLKEPYAPFLSNLTFGILPAHIWENQLPTGMILDKNNLLPIGSGPFQMDKLTKDKKGSILNFVLKRNEKYYAPKPYLDKITFKFFNDPLEIKEAYLNHQIHSISNVNLDQIEEIKNLPSTNLMLAETSQSLALFLNPRNQEALGNKKYRQAIEYAIDKDRIAREARKNYAKVIYLPIFFGMEPVTDIKTRNYQPDKAKEIIKSIGTDKLSLGITVTNWPESIKAAEIIKENLTAVGLTVDLQIMETTDNDRLLYGIVKPREFEALFFGETLGYEPDPYLFWHSSQIPYPGLNISFFENRKADSLLEEARQEPDWSKRQELYHEFQKILYDEATAIFIYNPQFIYAINKNVRGINLAQTVFYSDRFASITNWYLETKRVWK